MILELVKNATPSAITVLMQQLQFMGFVPTLNQHNGQRIIAVAKGMGADVQTERFTALAIVAAVHPFEYEYKLASRQYQAINSQFVIKGHTLGGDALTLMAGPCAIESEENIYEIAEKVSQASANVLRGGAYKPRTSPYSYQGAGEKGLIYLSQAAKKYNMLSISEAMSESTLEIVAQHVDIIQIGARNMQNFHLLKALGGIKKPILLKRGLSATYQEFLLAAEYILEQGNPQVLLCERGIRTFESHTRNTLDIAAAPILSSLSHLPVIIDPSHGTGLRQIVPAMAKAAVVAGAKGIMMEVHPDPDRAISDAKQTISTETFAQLAPELQRLNEFTVGMQNEKIAS